MPLPILLLHIRNIYNSYPNSNSKARLYYITSTCLGNFWIWLSSGPFSNTDSTLQEYWQLNPISNILVILVQHCVTISYHYFDLTEFSSILPHCFSIDGTFTIQTSILRVLQYFCSIAATFLINIWIDKVQDSSIILFQHCWNIYNSNQNLSSVATFLQHCSTISLWTFEFD